MNENIQKLFSNLGIWESKLGERAPNKPLLLLWMLGQIANGRSRMRSFGEIDSPLKKLLIEFGPPRKQVHTLYPFWYLKNDEIWELQNANDLLQREGKKEPLISEVKSKNVKGGFAEEIYNELVENPNLIGVIAERLAEDHFPHSFHDEILQAVGIEPERLISSQKRKRDPEFRGRVMIAYQHRCTVCGLDVRLDDATIGLEAAHIKWHQAEGPDVEENGLALCVLHHKMFDRGAFTIDPSLTILVSEKTSGSSGLNESLLCHHGKKIQAPIRKDYYPSAIFIEWHHREVFRHPAREIEE